MKRLLFVVISLLVLSLSVLNPVYAYPSEITHGVTTNNEDKAYEGFTLFTPLGGQTGTDETNEVYLINMQGDIVHKWKTEHSPGLYGFLLENGNLLYGGATMELEIPPGGGSGGVIQEIDWDGDVLWEYKNEYLHHDFDKLPNGNIVAMIWEPVKDENLYKVIGGIEGTELNGQVWTDVIIEIDYDTKEIIWEWHAQDEMDIENYPVGSLNNLHEWTHGNTVEYLPEGNVYDGKESIITSFRQIDTVMIIDKETKEIKWEWGQGIIKNQHDPTLLENGNVLLFDNGMHMPDGQRSGIPHSIIIEINPRTDEIEWEYVGEGLRGFKFFSSVISGSQRLPNGNTLICEGVPGRIFEVTRGDLKEDLGPMDEVKFDNEIVWEYINPYYSPNIVGNTVFRAYRYGLDDINWPEDMPDPNPEPQDIEPESLTTLEKVQEFLSEYCIWIISGLAGVSLILNLYLIVTKRRNV